MPIKSSSLINDPRITITSSEGFKLSEHPTDLGAELGKKRSKKRLEEDRERISDLQEILYASDRHSVLLIFQAMDAAGKDSCIRHVMSGVNPQGCQVFSFKAPSTKELDHDFLWRHACALPESGRIGIHNRSHYEEVLVVKVHPEYILGQRIPGIRSVKDITPAFWQERYESIRSFEAHLARQGTVIMKFFLNMSKEQQKQRFLARINDPKKNWKFSSSDIKERALWDEYMKAYEEAIRATATPHAPWYVVPADDQWETRVLVGRLLREKLESLGLKGPELGPKEKEALVSGMKALSEEK